MTVSGVVGTVAMDVVPGAFTALLRISFRSVVLGVPAGAGSAANIVKFRPRRLAFRV